VSASDSVALKTLLLDIVGRTCRGMSAYGFHQRNPEFGVDSILQALEEMEASGFVCRCGQLFYKNMEGKDGNR